MNYIKNLTVNNIKGTPIERVPENDWRDDYGRTHRAFRYHGVDIDQLTITSKNAVYVNIDVWNRWRELGLQVSNESWRDSQAYKIMDSYAPNEGLHREFCIEDLMTDIDKMMAELLAIDYKTRTTTIDMTPVKEAIYKEVDYAESIFEQAKRVDWYNLSEGELRKLHSHAHILERDIDDAKKVCVGLDELPNDKKQDRLKRLEDHGYVCINKDKWYFETLIDIINGEEA